MTDRKPWERQEGEPSQLSPDRLEALWRLRSVIAGVAEQRGQQQSAQPQVEVRKPRAPAEQPAIDPPQPWDRQPKEPAKHYQWFLAYRDLGSERVIRKATAYASSAQGGFGREAWEALPTRAQQNVLSYRRRVAARWHWKDRAEAWDGHLITVARRHADQMVIEETIRQAEEDAEEIQRQIRGGRLAVEAGSFVVRRLVQLYREGKLDELALERVKTVVISEGGSRAESERKSLVELLPAALSAIVEGQRIQRIAQERATDTRELKLSLDDVDTFADAIIKLLPEEQWDRGKDVFEDWLRGELGNGHS